LSFAQDSKQAEFNILQPPDVTKVIEEGVTFGTSAFFSERVN
jgi:hypothetical protein